MVSIELYCVQKTIDQELMKLFPIFEGDCYHINDLTKKWLTIKPTAHLNIDFQNLFLVKILI